MDSLVAVHDKGYMSLHIQDQCSSTSIHAISGNEVKTQEYEDALPEGEDHLGTTKPPQTGSGASSTIPPVSRLSAVLAQGEDHHNRLKAPEALDTFVPEH